MYSKMNHYYCFNLNLIALISNIISSLLIEIITIVGIISSFLRLKFIFVLKAQHFRIYFCFRQLQYCCQRKCLHHTEFFLSPTRLHFRLQVSLDYQSSDIPKVLFFPSSATRRTACVPSG